MALSVCAGAVVDGAVGVVEGVAEGVVVADEPTGEVVEGEVVEGVPDVVFAPDGSAVEGAVADRDVVWKLSTPTRPAAVAPMTNGYRFIWLLGATGPTSTRSSSPYQLKIS